MALVVVSGLYLAGVPPFQPKSPAGASPHGPVTFESARAAGDSTVKGYSGGSWQLVAAGALVARTSLSLPIPTSGTTLLNCSVRPVAGATVPPAPAFQGDPASGASPLWELVYWGSGSGLVVSVVNGTAQVAATISATSQCSQLVNDLVPVPTDVADSSTVVRAAAAAGGSAFLSSHPGANLSLAVVGGFSYLFLSTPARWQVTYSTCPLDAPAGGGSVVGLEFNATLNAAGVVTSSGLGMTNCSGLPSLGELPITGGVGFLDRSAASLPILLGPTGRPTRS